MRTLSAKDIGHIIRDRRRRQHLTQEEVAAKARVTARWLRDVEHGKDTAEIGKVLTVLAKLDLHVDVTPLENAKAAGHRVDWSDEFPDLDEIVGDGDQRSGRRSGGPGGRP